MTKTDYPGIDYGLGKSNVDEHGIRFGVISQNACSSDAVAEMEAIYAFNCPHCGNDLDDSFDADENNCPHCDTEICDGEQFSESPIGYTYDDGDLRIDAHGDGDMFVIKSPVVIRAQFCSPCAPGACHLETPCDSGAFCYALPMDWFDEYATAPYFGYDLIPTPKAIETMKG